MTTSLQTRFSSAVIFFVLIASAVFTVPARADSGSPPPAPTAPGGTTHSTAQVPTGAANSAGGGDQGHKVELSNQNAAYVAPAGDPVWCPSSMGIPTPGAGLCSINYGNMAGLVAYLTGNQKTVDGTIWINGGGPDVSGPNTMDGAAAFATMSFHKLTLKGGWTGFGGAINTSNPSLFSKTLNILNWKNDITLSDLQVNNDADVVPTGRGLAITTSGNITLTRVQANNNRGYGAYLDNTINSGTGIVKITDSQFNGDAIPADSYALEVFSNNAITITNVIVDNGWGALFYNASGINKPVTVKTSKFDNNLWYGLNVYSNGAITLNNVWASGNVSYGALLDNTSSLTASPVTLTGTNVFDSNASYGIYVLSKGKIISAPINVSNNGAWGAEFDNHTAATALPLSLSNSTFNANGGQGLLLWSLGAITITNLSAAGNGDAGVELDNNINPIVHSAVKVTGKDVFTNNSSNGLYIQSYGLISLSNITANGNGNDGVKADNSLANNPQSITLTGNNTFDKNSLNGGEFLSTGKVNVSGITAMGNNSYGVTIDNHFLGALMPQAVSVTGHNLLTNNFNNNLNVETYGAITISGLTANNSLGGYGAYLGAGGISAGNVTLNGLNIFNHNSSYGLYIVSKGSVVTNGLNAISNNSYGVYIDNTSSSIFAPVTLKGVDSFNFNGSYGLYIQSKGAVLTNGLSTLSNGNTGVYIDNHTSTIFAPVTLKGINSFTNNGFYGLEVNSMGAVITNGLSATTNSSYGVWIENNFGSSTAAVTLNGLSTFLYNGSYGLWVESNGAVITNGLKADSNLSYGVWIENNFTNPIAPVTLKGLNIFNKNGSYGLWVETNGTVLTPALTATNNSSYGVWIENNFGSSTAPVTLKGLGTYNNNASYGLYVESQGAVVTNGLNAVNNGSYGVYLENNLGSSTAPVTINGLNTFTDNSSTGLYAESYGTIFANNVKAINNGSYGVELQNALGSSTAPVTVKGLGTFNFNSSYGLYVESYGTVLTNGLSATSNGSYGVYLSNSGSSMPVPVTVKGLGTFINNGSYGLYIISKGAVLTNGLNATFNHSDGVEINNNFGSFAPVTLTGLNTFNDNNGNGLYVTSEGAVLINKLTATKNSSYGTSINGNPGSAAPVTLNGLSTFTFNGSLGLNISTYGAVVTNGLTAINNGGTGAYISNVTPGFAPVTLKGINTFNFNSSYGLDIASSGSILTSGLNANNNGNNGVNIYNNTNSSTAPVTLNGMNIFTNNNGYGAYVNSDGAVLTNNLNAIDNNGDGVDLINSFSLSHAPVTLNGLNTFNTNSSNGLYVYSKGAITTNNLNASDNGTTGVYIDNSTSGLAEAINLNGKNILFDNLGGSGAYVTSTGGVTINNISSKLNFDDGLDVLTSGNVVVSCGKFTDNGTSHVTGYGWETGFTVPSITLIGVTSTGNFSGDFLKDNAGTVVTVVPHACSLP